jgi:REP element-mobilizing transposase RayT
MPRPLRLEYPGAIYHVMNRGDRREPIFKDDRDRQRFLATLGEACVKTQWQVHAYCLMHNHFHLVIETPQANLVAGMKWLLGTYTARLNRRHKLFGHLFSGRYKSLVVDGSGNGYLRTVCDYVHLNPVRAKLLAVEQPLTAFPWSSYPEYLKEPGRRVAWLRVDRLFGEHGIPADTAAGRREFQLRLESRRAEEPDGDWRKIRRGWCLGGAEFREELLAATRGKLGEQHSAEVRVGSAEQQAARIVQEELSRRGWTAAELRARAKGDVEKVLMALRLRQETTVTLKWIAEHLAMGTWTSVAHYLSRPKPRNTEVQPELKLL